MSSFTGFYDHQLDTKNRIRIPSKLKGEEKGFYFAKGADRCIFVYTKAGFDELVEQMHSNVNQINGDIRKAIRLLNKSFVWLEGDAQGRMILPPYLKEYARIEQDIVICGADKRIEIWSKAVYDEYYKNEDEDVLGIYDMLGI